MDVSRFYFPFNHHMACFLCTTSSKQQVFCFNTRRRYTWIWDAFYWMMKSLVAFIPSNGSLLNQLSLKIKFCCWESLLCSLLVMPVRVYRASDCHRSGFLWRSSSAVERAFFARCWWCQFECIEQVTATGVAFFEDQVLLLREPSLLVAGDASSSV